MHIASSSQLSVLLLVLLLVSGCIGWKGKPSTELALSSDPQTSVNPIKIEDRPSICIMEKIGVPDPELLTFQTHAESSSVVFNDPIQPDMMLAGLVLRLSQSLDREGANVSEGVWAKRIDVRRPPGGFYYPKLGNTGLFAGSSTLSVKGDRVSFLRVSSKKGRHDTKSAESAISLQLPQYRLDAFQYTEDFELETFISNVEHYDFVIYIDIKKERRDYWMDANSPAVILPAFLNIFSGALFPMPHTTTYVCAVDIWGADGERSYYILRQSGHRVISSLFLPTLGLLDYSRDPIFSRGVKGLRLDAVDYFEAAIMQIMKEKVQEFRRS